MNTKDLTDSIVRPLNLRAGREFPLGIDPDDVQKIELTISDAQLDDLLQGVGERLLCLCPADELKVGVGFEIPGRNAYAVKVGVHVTQFQWPAAKDYLLLIVPDSEPSVVLPPEYVQMLEPEKLGEFEVVAGL
ncbi:MAG TPA: hypothetical protein VGL53_12510 [Bryobacteraceae bacterium]